MLSGIARFSNESLRESGCRNKLATKQDHAGIVAVRLLLQYPLNTVRSKLVRSYRALRSFTATIRKSSVLVFSRMSVFQTLPDDRFEPLRKS